MPYRALWNYPTRQLLIRRSLSLDPLCARVALCSPDLLYEAVPPEQAIAFLFLWLEVEYSSEKRVDHWEVDMHLKNEPEAEARRENAGKLRFPA